MIVALLIMSMATFIWAAVLSCRLSSLSEEFEAHRSFPEREELAQELLALRPDWIVRPTIGDSSFYVKGPMWVRGQYESASSIRKRISDAKLEAYDEHLKTCGLGNGEMK